MAERTSVRDSIVKGMVWITNERDRDDAYALGVSKRLHRWVRQRWPTYTKAPSVPGRMQIGISGAEACAQRLGAAVHEPWRSGQRTIDGVRVNTRVSGRVSSHRKTAHLPQVKLASVYYIAE